MLILKRDSNQILYKESCFKYETEVIEISFDLADWASYYEKDSCWRFESGSYLV